MKKKNQVAGFLACVLIMGAGSCRKTEPVEMHNVPQGQRTRSLIVQARGRVSASVTLPIRMQDAHMKNSEEVAVSLTSASSYLDSTLLSRMFEDVQSQGESLWGRYFADGQYAYCNNIRRYIENKYHLVCEKVFIYGSLTAVSPRYGCCASWVYDVACVLRGKDGVVYVIDPRLFTSVVTQKVWTESHLRPTECVSQPYLSNQALVTGESFTPLDNIPSGYLVDSSYTYTNIMLGYYADSVGCQNK